MRVFAAFLAGSLVWAGTARDAGAREPDSAGAAGAAPAAGTAPGAATAVGADGVGAATAREFEIDAENATNLLVVRGRHVERWRVFLRIDGVPARQARRDAMRLLLKRYDADGSGALSASESEALPTPFGIRQLSTGRVLPATASPPTDADLDGDTRLSLDELESYYAESDPNCLVCWGDSPRAGELSDSLIQALRLGEGRVVDRDGLQAAAKKLLSRDSNGDGLVSPGELIDGARYPGTSAASLARAAEGPPVLPLYLRPTRHPLPSAVGNRFLIRTLDRDGDERLSEREFLPAGIEFAALDEDANQSLGPEELAAWLARPPERSWLANVTEHAVVFRQIDPATGDRGPAQRRLWLTSPNVWTRIHGAPASRQAAWKKLDELVGQFQELAGDSDLDVNGNFAASPNQVEIERLARLVDADRDGRASVAELASWREFIQLAVRTQVVISVVDFQASLFAFLDEDHDGGLSRGELDAAWRRIERAGVIEQGRLDASRLPWQLRICVSLGRPAVVLDWES